jgi:hypothetical protein
LQPAPGYFEASLFQTFLIDGSTVSIGVQWERHNTNPLMPKRFDVPGTGAGGGPLFNPNERDVGQRELIDDYHRQTAIYNCLDSHRVFRHGINNETVNGCAPDSALIAFSAL